MYILFKGTMGHASVPTPLHTTPPYATGHVSFRFSVGSLQGLVVACSVCLTTAPVSLKISTNDSLKRLQIKTIDVFPQQGAITWIFLSKKSGISEHSPYRTQAIF